MTRKKRLYLSVLIPGALFGLLVGAGLAVNFLLRSGKAWRGGSAGSVLKILLDVFFSWDNLIAMALLFGVLGFALYAFLGKEKDKTVCHTLMTVFSALGNLCCLSPLLFTFADAESKLWEVMGWGMAFFAVPMIVLRTLFLVAAVVTFAVALFLKRAEKRRLCSALPQSE
ncbi:MAG: hypothetical protein J6S15_07660 [Clostridia bacterium]|nr:hypothetical protein [Clostridia bacterium]